MATIIIDFDGTCVTHRFPEVGHDIGAGPVLRNLIQAGHKIVLFTMRSDEFVESGMFKTGLKEAVDWFKENRIPLYGIQTNPTQKQWTTSPKAHGDLFIDDRGLGCPIKFDLKVSTVPFVDWFEVEKLLVKLGYIKH